MSNSGQNRLTRLLDLIPWLAAHEGVTITEAAEHFDVTPEQLQDDLWLAVCCGLPGYGPEHLIDIQFWDDDGHIDVIDPQALAAPASLSRDEAIALQLGLQLLRAVADDRDLDLIDSTMAALTEAALGQVGLEAGLVVATPTTSGVVATIHEALRTGRALRIDYVSATTDAASSRRVHPRRVIMSGGTAYLEAWCMSAQAPRSFRIDRLQSATLDEAITDGAHPDPDVEGAQGESDRATVADVWIHPRARWLVDTYADSLDTLDPEAAQSWPRPVIGETAADSAAWIPARLSVWDVDWLVRLTLSLGGDLVVLRPEPWAAAIADAARAALRSSETSV